MPFAHNPRPEVLNSLADAKPVSFWLDDKNRPEPCSTLTQTIKADLCIVGAGFTGLWAALLARESNPDLEVVLVEGTEAGYGASGRNGGFVDHCLTHSYENGLQRWPDEFATLVRLGYENLDAIEKAVNRYQIDCDFQRTGELKIATEAYQVKDLRNAPEEAKRFGINLEWWDREKARSIVNSPIYLGGLYDPRVAMVNPAQLVWGLRRVCLENGVRLFERTQVTGLGDEAKEVQVRTQYGLVRARQVILATNAFPPVLKSLKRYIVPVYDYALMTEPLTNTQREAIGWQKRIGVGDSGNQFHYYRTSSDGRILFGGYDAVYHWNNGFGPHLETNYESFGRLADHFFQTFPQLEGTHFTHAWGGAIDTCSRFSAFWGQAFNKKLAFVAGYTGLGVGASRFGAQVMLDLLNGRDNERAQLRMVHEKPVPFPPEPVRSAVVNLTRWSMDQADRRKGKRNLWLKLLDATGLGFDS